MGLPGASGLPQQKPASQQGLQAPPPAASAPGTGFWGNVRNVATAVQQPPPATGPQWTSAPPPAATPNNAAMAGSDPHNIGQGPGPLSGPGFGEQYGKDHVGQYDTPTAMETFAQQQLAGNNPYYEMVRKQGTDALNGQLAARGHFNSGGAMQALGNFNANLGANQFKDMGDLLGQAGTLGLQREAAGGQMATGVQNLQQGRLNNQWNQASDMAHLQSGLVEGAYSQGGQQSGDAAMQGINAGVNSAALTGKGQDAFGQQAWGALGRL